MMRHLIKIIEDISKATQYYIRFGEIPKDERSGIGASPNHIAHMFRTSNQEKGVSVYWARWSEEHNQWGIEDVGNFATFNELTYLASEGQRKIYLVTGDPVYDEEHEEDQYGIDGEPLIHNVKIIKELQIEDIFCGDEFDGRDLKDPPVVRISAKKMIIIYPDGEVKIEHNIDEPAEQIDILMGNVDGIEGTYQGHPAVLIRDYSVEDATTLPINVKGSELARESFRLPKDRSLKGKVLILVDAKATFKDKPYRIWR